MMLVLASRYSTLRLVHPKGAFVSNLDPAARFDAARTTAEALRVNPREPGTARLARAIGDIADPGLDAVNTGDDAGGGREGADAMIVVPSGKVHVSAAASDPRTHLFNPARREIAGRIFPDAPSEPAR